MPQSHLYHQLAKAFQQEGVAHCFALLGDANMNWAAAMVDLGCEFTYVRDEHCAVAAAMSWSRTTGEVGIASVTCGPGVTQILTALPAAVRAVIPLVVFAGEAPLASEWYNQEIDQRPLIEACGARYESLHHPEEMCQQIRDAFLTARTQQTPVVLGVPLDIQESIIESDNALPAPSESLLPATPAIAPDSSELEQATQLVCSASRIVVMAGRGAVLAKALPACKQFAEHVGGLLATSLPARGAFYDDAFCIGIAGGFSTDLARAKLQEADLIVAVGCSLAQHNSDKGKLFTASQVLHVDINPLRVSQGRPCSDYQLRSDACLGMEALLSSVEKETKAKKHFALKSWRTAELASKIKTLPADKAKFELTPGLLDPRAVAAELDSLLPADWFMVNSSGHCSYFFAQMPSRPVSLFLTIREFGAIGNGIAFAIGLARARPEIPIVLFDGDGSLLMHIQELETINRHKLNILICVLNDGAYGSEIHKLRATGLSEEGAVFGHGNLANIAKGFEVDGAVINDLTQLPALLDSFIDQGGAAVWDFHVCDKVVSPVIRRAHP